MKHFKRSLALALSVLLIISCMPITAHAISPLTISTSDKTAIKGSTVTVDINLSNNPGIGALTLYIYYDKNLLTYNNKTYGSIWLSHYTANMDGTNSLTVNATKESVVGYDDGDGIDEDIIAVSMLTYVNFVGNGTLLSVIFNVASVSSISDTPLKLLCLKASNTQNAGVSIPTSTVDGNVKILVPNSITVDGGDSAIAVPTLAAGGSAVSNAFTSTIYGSTGQVETDKNVTWSIAQGGVEAPAGVSIDANSGVVTVTNSAVAGTYTVTASINGYTSGTKEFTITRAPAVLTTAIAQVNNVAVSVPTSANNATVQLSYIAQDQFGAAITGTNIEYSLMSTFTGVSIDSTTGLITIDKRASTNIFSGNNLIIPVMVNVDGIEAPGNFTLSREDSIPAAVSVSAESGDTAFVSTVSDTTNLQYSVEVKDQYGYVISSPSVVWSIQVWSDQNQVYENTNNAQITSSGVVTIIKATPSAGYRIYANSGSVSGFADLGVTRKYNISVNSSYGNVTVVNSAVKDETVAVQVVPMSGYEITAVKYNGNTIASVSGTYSFTMPGADTTIDVEYKLASPTVTPDPASISLVYGEAKTIGVTVTHGYTNATYTYEWYPCDSQGSIAGQTKLSGTGSTVSVGTGLDVGTYYYLCVATADDSDTGTAVGSTTSAIITVTVTKRQLAPSVASVVSRPYNGTAEAEGSIALANAAGSETPTATGTFVWTDVIAGTSTVDVSGIVLDGNWGKNYTLSVTSLDDQSAGSSTITKAVFNGDVTGAKTVYNGAAGTASFLLSSLIGVPTGFFGAQIVSASVDAGSSFVDPQKISITASSVSFEFGPTQDTDTDTISIVISSTNHNDITATLTVTARNIVFIEANKNSISDYVSSLIKSTISYGTPNSGVLSGVLPSDVPAQVGETTVEGHFVLKDRDVIQGAGSRSVVIEYVIDTPGYSNVSLEAPFTFTVNKVTLIPSVLSVGAKVYNGDTTATGALALSGAVNGEKPAATGTFTWTSAAAGTTTVNVSGIQFEAKPTGQTGAWSDNYELAPTLLSGVTAPGGVAITRKEVTVSGIAASDKVYDGSDATTLIFSAVMFAGIEDGDTLTITATGAFEDALVGSTKIVNISNLSLGGTSVNNYELATTGNQTTTTANITKKSVIISGITAFDKVYDGNQTAILGYNAVSFDGIVAGDVLTVEATGRFDDANVGSGKTVTIDRLSLGGANASNYGLAETGQQTSATASITAKSVAVKFAGYENLVYDGSIKQITATYKDASDIDQPATVSFGEGVTVKEAGDYTATANTADINYTLTANTLNFSIAKLQLTIDDPAITTSKTYDRTTAASVTAGSQTNKVGSDDVQVSAVAAYADKNVGTGKTITVTYSISDNASGNYLPPVSFEGTGSITPLQLTIGTPTVTTEKTYDGNATAAVTAGNLAGVINGDAVSVSAEATYNDKTAGKGKAITIKYSLSGNDAANYIVPVSDSATGIINELQLTISQPTVTVSKVYDGSAAAVVKVGTLQNLVSGDTVAVTATAVYDSTNIGSGKTITVSYAISGSDAGNYLPPIVDDTIITGSITEKGITGLAIIDINDQPYTGSAITPSVTVKDGDKTLVSGTDYDVTYSNNTAVGTATVIVPLKGNYKGTLSKTFAIVGRVLTTNDVTISTISGQTYTGSALTPSLTVSLGGTVLTAGTDYTVSYSGNVNVGKAAVVISFKGGYSGTASTSFDIVKATPDVTVDAYNEELFAGGIMPTLTYSSSTAGKITFDVTSLGSSGNYNWTFTPTDTANYNAVTGSIALTVTPVALASISANYTQNTVFFGSTTDEAIKSDLASKIVVTGKNNNGTTKTLTASEYSLNIGANVNGARTVTVTATGNSAITTSFPITITEKKLSTIAITTPPTKTVYYLDGTTEFAADGMVVTAKYTDNTTAAVQGYSVSYVAGGTNGTTGLDIGDAYVVISYTEGGVTKSAYQSVSVAEKQVVELTYATVSGTFKSAYVEGESLNKTGLTVTAKYNDTASSTADVTEFVVVTYYDNNGAPISGNAFVATAAATKVTLSFGGQTVDLPIDPVDVTIVWAVGSTLTSETYDYNRVLNVPNVGSSGGFDFKGWTDGSVDSTGKLNVYTSLPVATSNKTYTAAYQRTAYTVSFNESNDFGGGTLNDNNATQTVYYGAAAKAPATPVHTGYAFLGWSEGAGSPIYTVLPVLTGATRSISYTAQYQANALTVSYYNEDGTSLINTEAVAFGQNATYNVPAKAATAQYSYTPGVWVTAANGSTPATLTGITSDLSVYASYSATTNEFTYKFYNETGAGSALKEVTAPYGTTIVKPTTEPTKDDTTQDEFTFSGYVGLTAADAGFSEGMILTKNISFKAAFSVKPRTYTITWDVEGKLTSEVYNYGATPGFKGSTAKPSSETQSFAFSGWDKPIVTVNGNATYTAQYTATTRIDIQYTVIFKNDDDTILSTQSVFTGMQPVVPGAEKAEDAQYTYLFTGWSDGTTTHTSANIPEANGDATYTAQYQQKVKSYSVSFVDYNGVSLTVNGNASNSYQYGTPEASIVRPADPTRTDAMYVYTFAGWSPAVADVTGNATYKAQYTYTDRKYELTVNTVFADKSQADKADKYDVAYGQTYTIGLGVTGYTAYVNNVAITAASITTPKVYRNAAITITYKPNKYYLNVVGYKGDSLVKSETTEALYNATKTVYIPGVLGHTAYLGGTAIEAGKIYDVTWTGSAWSATYLSDSAEITDGATLRVKYTATANRITTMELNYQPNQYTVTYSVLDSDGSVLDPSLYEFNNPISDGYTQSYAFGDTIIAPSAYRVGTSTTYYAFTGWNGLPFEMPAENITITGKFTSGQYAYRYIILDQFGNPISDGDYYLYYSDDYSPQGDTDWNPDMPFGYGFDYTGWAPYGMVLMDSTTITLASTQTVQSKNLTIAYGNVANGATVNYTIGGNPGTQTISGGQITIAVPYGSAYVITSPSVTGYSANLATVSGVMDNVNGKTATVTYTANSHTLTIYYLFEDGTTASGTYTESVAYGASYSKASPTVDGHTVKTGQETVSGTMGDTDVSATVTYLPNSYTLTINYKYVNNSPAATTVTQSLRYGDPYNVASPALPGYTASKGIVDGTITANTTVDVLYTSGAYAVYYSDGDGTVTHRYTLGDTVTPYTPSKQGYTFSGWTWSTGTAPTTMPASDIYATGSYTINSYTLTIPYGSVAEGKDVEYTLGNDTTLLHKTVSNGQITITMPFGTAYSVKSPDVSGYTPNIAETVGSMGAEDKTETTVTYTQNPAPYVPGGTTTGGSTTTPSTDKISSTDGKITADKITEALKAGTGAVQIETTAQNATFTVDDAATIADSKAELTVKTDAGSVKLSAGGLGELAASKHSSDSIKVSVAEAQEAGTGFKVVSGNTVLASVEVSIYVSDTKVTTGFGSLIITIPVDKSNAGKTVSIMHKKADGSYSIIEAVVDADGNAIFSVDSLSSFIVLKDKVASVANVYTDVESGDWFEGYVQYAYDEGLMQGVSSTTFAPNASASRAMIVTVLWRMAGSPTGNADAGFKDLTQSWYAEAVNWAFANGITTGKSATAFDPNTAVTREQLAAFLYRFAKYMGYEVSAAAGAMTDYDDAANVSSYATAAMQWAIDAGIITGRSESTLVPQGSSSRAELATMLTRFLQLEK